MSAMTVYINAMCRPRCIAG